MPREDLQLVAREVADEQDYNAGGSGFGANGKISEGRARVAKAVESEATIVGFGATRNVGVGEDEEEQGSVKFGWIVWPALRLASGGLVQQQVPMQKSLSALVSIPAWWKQVHICGRYEWLDTDRSDEGRLDSGSLCKVTDAMAGAGSGPGGAEAAAASKPPGGAAKPKETADAHAVSYEYDVALPFEIAMLDPVLFGMTRLADPRMFEWAMGDIRLTICEPASIIIPGQRLWRSAVVTVGSQQADEIVVLPNMEGIIAKFKYIDFPNGAGTPESSAPNIVGDILAVMNPFKPVVLTVWTSEGSVQYDRGVVLIPPMKPDGTMSKATSCAAAKAAPSPAPPATEQAQQ
jgi:hypothetical protein